MNISDMADTFEKVAEYVEELEAKLKEKDEASRKLQNSEHLEKLAGCGFTEEELGGLQDSTLEKLVKLAETPTESAWELGTGIGMAEDSMDPLTQFLMN